MSRDNLDQLNQPFALTNRSFNLADFCLTSPGAWGDSCMEYCFGSSSHPDERREYRSLPGNLSGDQGASYECFNPECVAWTIFLMAGAGAGVGAYFFLAAKYPATFMVGATKLGQGLQGCGFGFGGSVVGSVSGCLWSRHSARSAVIKRYNLESGQEQKVPPAVFAIEDKPVTFKRWIPYGNTLPGYYDDVGVIFSNENPFLAGSVNYNQINLMTLTSGQQWQQLPNAAYGGYAFSLANNKEDLQNNPYIAVGIPANPLYPQSSAITVSKRNQSSQQWEQVGSTVTSDGAVFSSSLIINQTGTPFIAYLNGSGNVVVSTFNGKDWVHVGSDIMTQDTTIVHVSLKMDANNTLFVAIGNYNVSTNAGKILAFKFVNNTWQPVGDTLNYTTVTSAPPPFAFSVTKQDQPYLAFAKGMNYQYPQVVTLSSDAKTWENVGVPFEKPTQMTMLASISLVSESGTPVMAYTNSRLTSGMTMQNTTHVRSFNPHTNSWDGMGNILQDDAYNSSSRLVHANNNFYLLFKRIYSSDDGYIEMKTLSK